MKLTRTLVRPCPPWLDRIGLALACLLMAACARLPAGPEGQPIQVPSPNHEERRPNLVIIHQTSNDNAENALRTLIDPARKVSAHYLIGRDGTLYQLVDEQRRAWHAGTSYWGGNTDINSASIGIELDNNGTEPFAEPQIARLLGLLRDLKERYQLPEANFIGHADVAPRRKVDPSRHFPWQRLAREGYGLWCQEPLSDTAEPMEVNVWFQALGYDVSDPHATLMAFRRHFLGEDSDAEITESEKTLLRCLVRAKGSPSASP